MYLLYLDDSGAAKNPTERYFVLGGLAVFEAQVDWFTRELDQLAEAFDSSNPADVEFHASEVFARRSHPWKDMTRDEARGVIKSVLQVVGRSYDSARVFACAVDKQALAPGVDPVEFAFEDLCSRFDRYLTRLHRSGDRHRGQIVLDKSTRETSLQRLTKEFRRIGTQWGAIRHLADVPFFVDSSASRLVQAADHVAHAVFRRYNAGDTQYFDLVAPKFDFADGVVHGLAHKTRPGETCLCPACLSRTVRQGDQGSA